RGVMSIVSYVTFLLPAKATVVRNTAGVLPYITLGTKSHPNFPARSTVLAHPFVVLPLQTLVAPIAPLVLVVGHLAAESHARDHEMVRAQQFRHSLGNIGVQPTYRSAHHNHSRHADNDANH